MDRWIRTTPSDRAILAYMMSRQPHHYHKSRITYYVIARDMDLAESTVSKSLRKMEEERLLVKLHRSWRVNPDMRKLIRNILNHPFGKYRVKESDIKPGDDGESPRDGRASEDAPPLGPEEKVAE